MATAPGGFQSHVSHTATAKLLLKTGSDIPQDQTVAVPRASFPQVLAYSEPPACLVLLEGHMPGTSQGTLR